MDVELRDVVEDVVALLAERAHTKGLEISSLVHRDVPAGLRGDPDRLRQIPLHLVGKAVKFTERGEVVVRIRHERDLEDAVLVHFEVADTGIGLTPDQQAAPR